MAIVTRTFAAASCSWIDSATALPEVDKIPFNGPTVARASLTGNQGFRFCNFTEVWASFDTDSGNVNGQGFSNASGIYTSPSYAKVPSYTYPKFQNVIFEPEAVCFTQVVGARTVSPEVLGAGAGVLAGLALGPMVLPYVIAGGLTGKSVAHSSDGLPPIWSKIQIRIYKDGRLEGQLLQHSKFPSLTFFLQGTGTVFKKGNHPSGTDYYNATKAVQYPDWKAKGWGGLEQTSKPGPTAGNPWAITK